MVLAAPHEIADPERERDFAGIAEVTTRQARRGIDCDEARVGRGSEDTPRAGDVAVFGIAGPGCDATADELVGVVHRQVGLGIVNPDLFAGFGIERENTIERAAGVHHVVQ